MSTTKASTTQRQEECADSNLHVAHVYPSRFLLDSESLVSMMTANKKDHAPLGSSKRPMPRAKAATGLSLGAGKSMWRSGMEEALPYPRDLHSRSRRTEWFAFYFRSYHLAPHLPRWGRVFSMAFRSERDHDTRKRSSSENCSRVRAPVTELYAMDYCGLVRLSIPPCRRRLGSFCSNSHNVTMEVMRFTELPEALIRDHGLSSDLFWSMLSSRRS